MPHVGPLPGSRPSPATVAALSDGPARDRVRAGVEVSDRVLGDGFDESWAYVAGTLFPTDHPVADGVPLAAAPSPESASS